MSKNIWLDGIMGVVTGDALGLPVQFLTREEIAQRQEGPVIGMEGHGTFDVPVGSWSDDSSLSIATLDSLIEKKEIVPDDIMKRFAKWLKDGEYTPFGYSYDVGKSCMTSITKYILLKDWKSCGRTGEHANGNGALMRILPVCLYYVLRRNNICTSDDEAIQMIHDVTALTHNHLRAQMASGLYYFMVKSLADNREVSEDGKPVFQQSLKELLQSGLDQGFQYYRHDFRNMAEMSNFSRLFVLDSFQNVDADGIKSTGYVVDSIEAAVWCLITTNSLKDCLLKAVNLGYDTDSVAAIAGGLAGLYYGYEAIPEEWLRVIQRRDYIEDIVLQPDELSLTNEMMKMFKDGLIQ